MKRFLYTFSLLLAAVAMNAQTVTQVVVDSDIHETLETAVIAAELDDDLAGPGPFTLFAPTDEAFNNLPAGVLDALLLDPTGALADVLLHHVVSGNVTSDMIMPGPVETLFGQDVLVTVNGDDIMVNGAMVTVADIPADNGVVHVIDAVLLPPAPTVVDIIVESPVHETLETAVGAANLVGALQGEGPFTVFAPTDEAFNNLPAGALDALLADPEGALADVLLYHVYGDLAYSTAIADGLELESLNGDDFMFSIVDGSVFINDAEIIITDIIAENGVVHVIDAVILPPTTVVDVIVGSDVHETLETAVGAAGLVETLSGDGPFTVFAPTDEAFDNLPAGVLDALLADPEGALADVLTHHVVSGNVLAGDLSTGPVTTLFGDAWVTVDGDMIMINNATVIIEDLVADNGVVHVIDAVIDMPAATVVDIIVNSDVHETLELAVTEANLVGALQGEGPFTVFAPTDEAFDNLPAGVLDDLLADPEGALANVLLYHVYGDLAYSTDITDGLVLEMLNGDEATLTIDGGVFINDAEIIITDLIAQNGVVHVIDAVIVPPAPNTVVDVIVNSDVHETLETAVGAAGLVETLSGDGPFTVFAPTDEAFGNLPAGVLDDLLADPEGALTDILLHHVVDGEVLSGDLSAGPVETLYGQDVLVTIDGGDIFINGAQVIIADIPADNGVVHVIDAVLLTPAETIVDIIVNSDVHEVLETAVGAAGLVDDLQGDGPFTVFAPTDAAFANLPAGALDDLLADPEGALANVLLYHVYGDLAYSTDISDGLVLDMLNGDEATITIDGGSVLINDSEIIITDLIAENGVVHVIDAVLLPPVSVAEVAFADLTLYPNPAYDYINVTADAPAGTEYQIMDQTGRVITTGNFNGLITIDVRELPTGIYNLMMIGDDTSAVKQFMVK